jgi:hypothetical protein
MIPSKRRNCLVGLEGVLNASPTTLGKYAVKLAIKAAAVATIGLIAAGHANAQNFAPPPANGLSVYDLAGTSLGASTYQSYSTSFTATSTTSTVSFLFRNDPGYFGFADPSVADSSAPSLNLLTNGNFATGNETGWSYFEQTGVGYTGAVGTTGDPSGLVPNTGDSYFWVDGATQGYDGITQSFTTTIGDSYDITFDLAQLGGDTSPAGYQQLSTNGDVVNSGGNGVDMLVYAGAGTPTESVPEPATLLLLGAGSVGLGVMRRRRR